MTECNKAAITSLLEGITPTSEPIEIIPYYVTPEKYYSLFAEPVAVAYQVHGDVVLYHDDPVDKIEQ